MKNKLFYVVISIVLIAITALSIMNWFKLNNNNKSIYPEYSYAYDEENAEVIYAVLCPKCKEIYFIRD